MPRAYKKIKYEDRLKIQQMCSEGAKPSEIAKKIGIHRATIYKELARGGAPEGHTSDYKADTAQRAIFA
ncbi:MAG: helix-turn-helix domain-containing protein [Lachnospiraceae bacterium]|nr:helix-turn-helix domain-containing protein [Lachnospiraceae bacterium]